jgi:hypothetical protein
LSVTRAQRGHSHDLCVQTTKVRSAERDGGITEQIRTDGRAQRSFQRPRMASTAVAMHQEMSISNDKKQRSAPRPDRLPPNSDLPLLINLRSTPQRPNPSRMPTAEAIMHLCRIFNSVCSHIVILFLSVPHPFSAQRIHPKPFAMSQRGSALHFGSKELKGSSLQ